MSKSITGAAQGGVKVGANALAGPKLVDFIGGTLSMLSTGAAQGGWKVGRVRLQGPGFG